jgi:predicted phage tail protein
MTTVVNEYTEVILAGELGKKFGRVWNLVVKNPIHALRLIGLNRPDFRKHLRESAEKGLFYHVIVDKRHRSEAELRLPAGKRLIIAPAVQGAGGKTFAIFELVASAVLAIVTFGTSLIPESAALAAASMAAGLALSGITGLLTTVPKVGTGQSSAALQSSFFNGATNTQLQGTQVPVVYGEMLIGSQVVSAALSAVDASSAGQVSGLVKE